MKKKSRAWKSINKNCLAHGTSDGTDKIRSRLCTSDQDVLLAGTFVQHTTAKHTYSRVYMPNSIDTKYIIVDKIYMHVSNVAGRHAIPGTQNERVTLLWWNERVMGTFEYVSFEYRPFPVLLSDATGESYFDQIVPGVAVVSNYKLRITTCRGNLNGGRSMQWLQQYCDWAVA